MKIPVVFPVVIIGTVASVLAMTLIDQPANDAPSSRSLVARSRLMPLPAMTVGTYKSLLEEQFTRPLQANKLGLSNPKVVALPNRVTPSDRPRTHHSLPKSRPNNGRGKKRLQEAEVPIEATANMRPMGHRLGVRIY